MVNNLQRTTVWFIAEDAPVSPFCLLSTIRVAMYPTSEPPSLQISEQVPEHEALRGTNDHSNGTEHFTPTSLRP